MTARTHGLSGTSVYQVWRDMLRRCENPNEPSYENYGARGISVCARWHDVTMFALDMGEPSQGQTIERIDVNGDYEPGNCRWATVREQLRNTWRNHYVDIDGKSMCLQDVALAHGIKAPTLRKRLKRGWRIEDALMKNSDRGFRVSRFTRVG